MITNRYGAIAQRHWREADPERYLALPSPDQWFQTLGEEVEQRIQELTDSLAGPDLPNEQYLEKVGRLNMARLQAQELALAELVWLPSPEPEETPQDSLSLSRLTEESRLDPPDPTSPSNPPTRSLTSGLGLLAQQREAIHQAREELAAHLT